MEHYIGLMSGTSLDAIDAALVSFEGNRPILHHAINFPLDDALRDELHALCTPGDNEIDRLGQADIALGRSFAAAAQQLLKEAQMDASQVTAIGSHGQTLRHRPDERFTLQIGDPNSIAQLSGITTVADFRRRDMAAGGQGAPLAPAFHAAFWGADGQARVILNIGGMANVTLLPGTTDTPASGFDTGPGNVLLDAWIQRHRQQAFDRDGRWAASGTVSEPLLREMLNDPFFQLAPPKSTGREHFNMTWLQGLLDGRSLAEVDVQATLSELTAASIADAVREHATDSAEVVVCGGGARNADLLRRLGRRLAPIPVVVSDEKGLAADWVEAAAFAWLARETLAGRAGNLPTVTGARQSVVLGGIYAGTAGER
ncbi:MAG TPA: anhydro-N-acetylmuramic acid kinase [Gammaproteobacteria bacterium]|nr:anhydro-N-acetylmuramic acid kinase [Gammaproteobacteria bacterium]